MPFLRGCAVPFNPGRAFLCCRDTVLPLHSDSGMHPFIEAIWCLILSRYIGSSTMAKRDCVEIRERCKRQLSQEGRDAQKEGRRGSSSLSCTVKKCGKTKQTVYTVTVFYNNRKVIVQERMRAPKRGKRCSAAFPGFEGGSLSIRRVP